MNSIRVTGASRIVFIVGDPIEQVKSPSGMTHLFQSELNEEILVIPARVKAEHFQTFVAGAKSIQNCIGIIATIPHKFRLMECCHQITDAAKFIGAANIAKFEGNKIIGHHVDGEGMLLAVESKSIAIKDKTACLVGAGGAGSAIAYALLKAGCESLRIFDADAKRAEMLVVRLSVKYPGKVLIAAQPTGANILVNATPLGMSEDDPIMFDEALFAVSETALDVVTGAKDTELIQTARKHGLNHVSGNEMFLGLRKPMADFLLS